MYKRKSKPSKLSNGKPSKYTVHGLPLPAHLHTQRIYQPTYQLKSNTTIDSDHIQLIIKNSVLRKVAHAMPVYDPIKAKELAKNISDEIKFRIEILNYDRMRTVVIANVTEQGHQGINWRVGALLDSSADQSTSFQHETASFIVTVYVALVYWEWSHQWNECHTLLHQFPYNSFHKTIVSPKIRTNRIDYIFQRIFNFTK